MTTEETIRMARENGLQSKMWVNPNGKAAELDPALERLVQAAYAAGAAAEREANEKVCDDLAGGLRASGDKDGAEVAVILRAAIRARGQV